MITSTVLHAGFINEAVEALAGTTRWESAIMRLSDWALPEEERRAARSELREMELDAWAAAGEKYRRALRAYEAHVSWNRMMSGHPVGYRRPGTAIEYQEPPKPPIHIHF